MIFSSSRLIESGLDAWLFQYRLEAVLHAAEYFA